MRILFVVSEVAPFSKTGGLADVAQALPSALAARGHEVTVVTPLYRSIQASGLRQIRKTVRLRFPFGEQKASLSAVNLSANHQVVFLDHPGFYDREGLYHGPGGEYPDNDRRFGFLAVGALAASQALSLNPDIVHLNDWQTALGAVALARGYRETPLGNAPSVLTIHNLAYQGIFPKRAMSDLGLPWDLFTPDQLEFYDQVNFLKGGIAFADALTTVSKTYAQEIQSPELGFGLDGMLRSRADSLHGILNGVDYSQWDPSADRLIAQRYSAADLSGKAKCKRAVLEGFSLPMNSEGTGPVFALISRLASQKGIDILLQALPWVLEENLYFLALGIGDPSYEQGLRQLAKRWPEKVAVQIDFDPALSHQVEAGSDFLLMPSRYEPCGLNQMYSLRYGTVPIVRATGGLQDTVVDISEPRGTGIKFQPYTASALASSIHRALDLYATPGRLNQVRKRGMEANYSWDASADEYLALYESMLHGAVKE
jgi:starch synthase